MTVVLTRPVAQALPLAERLRALGYGTELFPLLEIQPLPDTTALRAALADISRYAMVAFVSPNAIHSVFGPGVVWPPEVALAVVGEGSRMALAQYGITAENFCVYCPTDPFRTDSETLLNELDLPALKGREVLIVRAETGRELLSDALSAHGIFVSQVAAYRRLAPQLSIRTSQQLLKLAVRPACWVISSSEALRTLLAMVREAGGDAGVVELKQIKLLVSHQRIAETAHSLGFICVRLVGSGDENLLLALQSVL